MCIDLVIMYMYVICLFNEITKVLIVHALYMYVTCLFNEITKKNDSTCVMRGKCAIYMSAKHESI